MGERSDCSATTRTPSADSDDGVAAIEPASLASEAPHLPQKFDAGVFSAPHLGHSDVSAFPHWMQKLLPGGLSVPHFEQRISLSELANRGLMYHLTAGEHY
jgi:hypothetical protein